MPNVHNRHISHKMKKLYLIAFILGLICSFGQPPFNYAIASLCSLSLFFYLLNTIKNTKQIIWFSFLFGYGYYIYSYHWPSESVLTYGDQLLWLYPLGIIFIPAFFALYFILLGYLITKFAKNNVFLIALIWLVVEFIRSYVYIESPWILIGYIWSNSNIISQSASLFSIWGLSFLSLIWAGAIYSAVNIYTKKDISQLSIIYVALISFIACYLYGEYRLNNPPKLTEQDAKIRIIQANIDRNIYSRMRNHHFNFMKHINASQTSKDEKIDYIIWPEGAHEYSLNTPGMLDTLRIVIPEDSLLILNATRREGEKHWNSLYAIDHNGEVFDYYDKIHLVPLGEFIPFRTILPFISKLTSGGTDYSTGDGGKIINARHPFMPSVCYEAAFPESNPGFFTWILNITNDGWFGTSIGPYQHLAIAKFRSIEQGVPMARGSLTGISAIIDSFGNITKNLPLLTTGILDAQLPGYITKFTFYRYYGYYSVILLILSIFLLEKCINFKRNLDI